MYLLPSEIKLCVKTINKIKDAEGRKGLGGTRGCMREKKTTLEALVQIHHDKGC